MRKLVIILEIAVRQVGIHLRSGERRMAEQTLHGIDVGAVVEHISGKRMTHHVRRAATRVHSTVKRAMHYAVEQSVVQLLAAGTHKNGRA